MVTIPVSEADKKFAKQQIDDFEKCEAGSWRYKGVEAWRGIVCEMLSSKWLSENFSIDQAAKGLDTSGIPDDYDLLINGKKIEIKSATKNYFRSIMPKIHDINAKPKDIYIGTKYNEEAEPNEIQIIGFIKHSDILKFPVKQNKGAPYYDIPLSELKEINNQTFE